MKNRRHNMSSWERVLQISTLAYVPLAAALTGAAILDDSIVNGEAAWLKPLKFAVSIGLNGAATLWLIRRLPRTRITAIATVASAAALLGEQVLITVQAGRGVASHFNVSTGFDSAVFSAMGALIAIVWSANLALALVASRRRSRSRSRSGKRPPDTVVTHGLWLVLLGSSVGFVMIAAGRHSIGSLDGVGDRLAVVGWNASSGDLRPAHFIGIHGLQLLIVTSWLLGDRARREPVLRMVSFATAGACLAATAQALAGRSITSPSTILVAAVTLAGAAVGARTAGSPGRDEATVVEPTRTSVTTS